MSGRFKNGVSINNHAKNGNKMQHLRIKAGPQRDHYVHDLVCRAKIIGRRESFEREHPGQPIPETEFYSLSYETVEHDNGNSLDNEPTNLIPMTLSENVRRMNQRRWGNGA
jgi:hypothetical protein